MLRNHINPDLDPDNDPVKRLFLLYLGAVVIIVWTVWMLVGVALCINVNTNHAVTGRPVGNTYKVTVQNN